MTTTFYDVLGVSEDATTEDIRAAYRARLKESHPDLNDDEDASDRTKRIIRARDVLTDDDERERYDRLGHAAYVGQSERDVDETDVSSAASAARSAGWADGAEEGGRSDADTGGRRRARDRRRREREARERVGDVRGGATDESAERSASTDGNGATPTGGGTATVDGGVADETQSWNASATFSVRQRYEPGVRRRRLFPTTQSLVLLVVAFVLYPVMVFAALFPSFPLFVNVVVALCIVFLVGYLQSIPEVAVVVFGGWSGAMPFALAELHVGLTSLHGVLALTLSWVPFGLSLLTFAVVRDQL